MAVLIPLRQKYREAKPSGHTAKSRTGASKGKAKRKEGSGGHRRAYGPWWYLKFGSQLPITYETEAS